MSSPQLVPMIAQDGSIGDVPAGNVDAALSRGLKRGVNVISKDGQKGTIPLERLGEALQSGMMPEHAMQMRRPMNSNPSLGEQIDSGLQTVGNAVPGAIQGMLHAVANPVQAGSQMAIAGMQSAEGQPTTGSKVAATAAPFVGVDPEAVKKAAITAGTTGNYGPLVATGVLPLAAAHLGTSKAGPQLDAGAIVKQVAAGEIDPGLAATTSPKPPTPAEAITNAINPPAKQMAGMDKTVEAQLPNILKYAQENKVPIRNRQDFVTVARQAGDAARADYKANVLGPHENVPADTTQIPNYSGDHFSPNSATLGQLESRLSQVNSKLTGKYEKGAGQALPTKAALSSGEAAALDAEANGIRSILNQQLASRTGLTAEQVSAARAKGASMAGLADKMQMALNAERRAANIQDNSPAELDVTATGLAKDYATKAYRAFAGKPADRAIRDALARQNGHQ